MVRVLHEIAVVEGSFEPPGLKASKEVSGDHEGGSTMQVQRFIIGSALLILTGCQHSLVRDSMPTVTRTGEVKDVVILEGVSPATLSANPGDEIRWINKRQGDVRIIFLTPVMEQLTCERNFGGIAPAERNQYTAKLGSNDTASVCLRTPAELKYVVRAENRVIPAESRTFLARSRSILRTRRADRRESRWRETKASHYSLIRTSRP